MIRYIIRYIEVMAKVRYWEDATVNGVEDDIGTFIPCREGNMWHIVIDVYVGRIKDWVIGTTAQIHYKVCDAIEVWLLDEDGLRTHEYNVGYVPDFLSIGENGYGDYIIMDVDENGMIDNWKKPVFKKSDFDDLLTPKVSTLIKQENGTHTKQPNFGPATPLVDCLKNLKFGRPAASQILLDKWIRELQG